MIYYVEDGKNIRDLATYALNQAGFEVVGFSCAEDFENACSSQMPDLVLLDIMLPGKDGLGVNEAEPLHAAYPCYDAHGEGLGNRQGAGP